MKCTKTIDGTDVTIEVSPQVFYKDCSNKNLLCNSDDSALLPAITVCNLSTISQANSDRPVVANFTIDDDTPLTGQTVDFTDTSRNSPTSWLWNFGDGGSSIQQNPSHSYATANTYEVSLQASNGFGSSTKTRNITVSAPAVIAPVNLSLPVISGTLQQGQTLSSTNGTWSGTPASYLYQWKRNGSTIVGATSNSYILGLSDISATITITVTAQNAGGNTPATSNATNYIAPASVITSFAIGVPSGQIPNVHIRDITHGFDLYTANPDAQFVFPASVIKLMTLFLAWEYHGSDWTTGNVTVLTQDIDQAIPGITMDRLPFQDGDIVTWEKLSYAILLPSAGDACRAIGRVIGNEIYVAAGSTGSSGLVRFVERMNERAAELGMTNTTYWDTEGGSKTFSPDTIRNVISARDLSTICERVMTVSALRTAAGTPTYSLVITGPNARTVNINAYNKFINGPIFNQSGIKDANVLGGKNGVWLVSGTTNHNLTQVWVAPNGTEILITTLGSESDYGLMLDQRGMMYSLLTDYPYLLSGTTVGNDTNWNNVKALVSASTGSITDQSSVGRSVTATSVGIGAPILGGHSNSMTFNNVADMISIASAADIQVGSGDMTIEMWVAGDGTIPGSEIVWFSKGDNATNKREWLANDFGGNFQVFASTDGANWNSTSALNMSANQHFTFYNGAIRHIAFVKNGSSWSMYINGDKLGNSLNIATAFTNNGPMTIGANGFAVSPTGRVDDWRCTFGVARYTANMITLVAREFPRS